MMMGRIERLKRTSGLGFIHSSIWVRFGPASPEAVTPLFLGRVISQDFGMLARTMTMIGSMTESPGRGPRASGGRGLIHAGC